MLLAKTIAHNPIMKATRFKNTMFNVFLLCLLPAACQQTPQEIATDYYSKGMLNGTVLIVENNRIVCDTAVGYRNFQTREKTTTDTPFYIASLSKPFTATAILLLQQRGALSFDDKASKYIAQLPNYAKNLTIRQLLNHTSGIPDYESALTGQKGLTNRDICNWLHRQKNLKFPSGSTFEYSNTGYIILALIIEHLSGTSYRMFLKENIFVPLKMNHTTVYDESRPVVQNRAIGFDKQKRLDDYATLTTGDGGIYSTTGDLLKFDRALRNYTLINKQNTALMYTPPTLHTNPPAPYGFGWFLYETSKEKAAGHTGGLNGYRTLFWRDLRHPTVVIVLTNQGDAFPVNDFLNEIKKTWK